MHCLRMCVWTLSIIWVLFLSSDGQDLKRILIYRLKCNRWGKTYAQNRINFQNILAWLMGKVQINNLKNSLLLSAAWSPQGITTFWSKSCCFSWVKALYHGGTISGHLRVLDAFIFKSCAQIVDNFWRNTFARGNLIDLLAPLAGWQLGQLPGWPVPYFAPAAIPLDME